MLINQKIFNQTSSSSSKLVSQESTIEVSVQCLLVYVYSVLVGVSLSEPPHCWNSHARFVVDSVQQKYMQIWETKLTSFASWVDHSIVSMQYVVGVINHSTKSMHFAAINHNTGSKQCMVGVNVDFMSTEIFCARY